MLKGMVFGCFSAQLYSVMFSLIESFHERTADIRDQENTSATSTNLKPRSCITAIGLAVFPGLRGLHWLRGPGSLRVLWKEAPVPHTAGPGVHRGVSFPDKKALLAYKLILTYWRFSSFYKRHLTRFGCCDHSPGIFQFAL